MTEGQFDRLLDLLEEALSLASIAFAKAPFGSLLNPDSFKSGAESLEDRIPGVSVPTPTPDQYRAALDAAAASGPKRKRGRPRKTPVVQSAAEYIAEGKTPEQRATREMIHHDAQIAAFAPESFHHEGLMRKRLKEAMKNEQATYTCTHCGRVFPETIHDLHEANCSRSAAGYASHEATPGKR